jgi:hypothetical protein
MLVGIAGDGVQRLELSPGIEPQGKVRAMAATPALDGERQLRAQTEKEAELVENILPALFACADQPLQLPQVCGCGPRTETIRKTAQCVRDECPAFDKCHAVFEHSDFGRHLGDAFQHRTDPAREREADDALDEPWQQQEWERGKPGKDANQDEDPEREGKDAQD